jgi:hypothetical protein
LDLAVDRPEGALLMRHFVALLLCSCVYEWNGDQPVFPLTGNPPPLSSFQKLNQVTAGRPTLMTGPDGVNWLAFCEFWPMGNGNGGRGCAKLRLVRLGLPGDAPVEEAITADSFSLQNTELYEMRDDMKAMTRTVTLHRPGASDDVSFVFRQGKALLYSNFSGSADVFVYWIMDTKTDSLSIYRRDRKYQRNLPLPADVDPTKTPDPKVYDFLFTADGDTLVVRTSDGSMTAYSTLDEGMVPLGKRPQDFTIDDTTHAVLTFGDDGYRSVPLDGSAETVFASAKIDIGSLGFSDTLGFWADEKGLWEVPLDGSAPAQLVQPGAARLWNLSPSGQITYSKDPRGRYAGNAGDGWVGDWNFMERGRLMGWSSDGARIHFLEHAATVGTYGDLTSVSVPGGGPRILAVNAHNWAELPDHRILAVENAVYAGTWNRLVVIDEVANTKRWVVPECADFFLINNGTELIADVVSGASGFDILRVPAP